MPFDLDTIVDASVPADAVEAVVALLESIEEGGSPFLVNVFQKGDFIESALPYAVVHLGEDAKTTDTTSREFFVAPLIIETVFARPTLPETPQERHRKILHAYQAVIAEDPTLGVPGVTDCLYDGLGLDLVPLDDALKPHRFVFAAEFRLRYRYRRTDPSIPTAS